MNNSGHVFAEFLVSRGRYDEAMEQADRALAADPGDAEAHALKSICHHATGRPHEGDIEAMEALRYDPNCANAHYALAAGLLIRVRAQDNRSVGITYLPERQRRLEKALASIRTAVSLSPDNAHFLTSQARILAELGRDGESRTCLELADAADPNDVERLDLLADLCIRAKEFEKATAYLSRALQIDPRAAVIHRTRGKLYYHLNEFNQAVSSFQTALELEPNSAASRNGLLECLRMKHIFYRPFGRLKTLLERRFPQRLTWVVAAILLVFLRFRDSLSSHGSLPWILISLFVLFVGSPTFYSQIIADYCLQFDPLAYSLLSARRKVATSLAIGCAIGLCVWIFSPKSTMTFALAFSFGVILALATMLLAKLTNGRAKRNISS